MITDIAEMVLNKCTDTNADRNIRPDSKDYAIIFNYQFLEDEEQATELVMSFVMSYFLVKCPGISHL